MNDLEKRQREMRERTKQQPQRKKATGKSAGTLSSRRGGVVPSPGVTDLERLEQRVAALEAENAELRIENERLRGQKTVYVERQKSAEEERRERVHNYFKYSNTRRW